MFNNFVLSENWIFLLFVSFALVSIIISAISSTWKQYYKNIPLGRLSHSQLRVKQGNATTEQRLNVFVHTLMLSLFQIRTYLLSILLWAILNLLNHFQLFHQ